ncbi:MAG: hypothetical protein QGD94_00530 [Planctomycetia bacterium]|nr:hypothetical protein [Planctomycetia bacterium]
MKIVSEIVNLSFTQKANRIRLLHQLLRRRLGAREFHKPIHPVEHAVKAVLWELATAEQVESTMNKMRRSFVDWNEVRVSRPREIREVLGSLPGAAAKAEQIPLLLHEVFLRQHSMFWTDFLENMSKREMRDFFSGISGLRRYIAAVMARDYAGMHAFPVDADIHRVLVRLGIFAPGMPEREAHGFMERAVKSKQAYEVHALLRELAERLCVADNPLCSRCPLRQKCPSAEMFIKQKATRTLKARRDKAKRAAAKKNAAAKKKAAKKKAAKGPARKATATRRKKVAGKTRTSSARKTK